MRDFSVEFWNVWKGSNCGRFPHFAWHVGIMRANGYYLKSTVKVPSVSHMSVRECTYIIAKTLTLPTDAREIRNYFLHKNYFSASLSTSNCISFIFDTQLWRSNNLQFLKKRREIKGANSLSTPLPRCPTDVYAEKSEIGVRGIAEETRSLTRRDRVTTPSLKRDLANKFARRRATIGPLDAYIVDPRCPYKDCPRDIYRPRYRWAITDWEADLGPAGKPRENRLIVGQSGQAARRIDFPRAEFNFILNLINFKRVITIKCVDTLPYHTVPF